MKQVNYFYYLTTKFGSKVCQILKASVDICGEIDRKVLFS